MAKHQPTLLGRLSIGLLIVIVGIPAGFLLILGTWGTVLIPFVVAVYAALLFLLHYLLWGRTFSRRIADEAKQQVASVGTIDRWW